MTRDEFIELLHAGAERLGLDVLSAWKEIPLWSIEFCRPGVSPPILSVHLRTHGECDCPLMHVAILRPGDTLDGDVPVGRDGVSVPARHYDVRLGPGDWHREVIATFKAEARRALGMPLSEAHEANLSRAVRDAVGDDPEMAADLVAAIMVEAGLGSRLQVSLDERLNSEATPSPR